MHAKLPRVFTSYKASNIVITQCNDTKIKRSPDNFKIGDHIYVKKDSLSTWKSKLEYGFNILQCL